MLKNKTGREISAGIARAGTGWSILLRAGQIAKPAPRSEQSPAHSISKSVKLHLTSAWPVLAAFYLPAFLVLGVVLWSRQFKGISPSFFTVDPLAMAHLPFYAGLLSNLGVLLWCTAAAIYLFTFFLLSGRQRAERNFLLASGLLTVLLLCDDLFMLHEAVFPSYLHLPEIGVYAAYLALVLSYLFRFRSAIMKTEFTILAAAFLFFGASILIDIASKDHYLSEDGCKFLGIVAWAIYASRSSRHVAAFPGSDGAAAGAGAPG